MGVEADTKILTYIDDWRAREGSLPQPVELYEKLLKVQVETQKKSPALSVSFNKQTIKEQLIRGTPLLRFSDIAVDWPLLYDTLKKVVSLAGGYTDSPQDLLETVNGITTDQLKSSARSWYDNQSLPSFFENNRDFFNLVLGASIRPFLVAHAETLAPLIDQECWRRGYCPICGGVPDISFLDKDRGARWLVCSRCDTQWLFQRLECPSCGNQDQSTLAFFTTEAELYRLYVCEKCKGYIKAIDLRRTEKETFIPLERILTLDLDTQAHESGYKYKNVVSPAQPDSSSR